jgi:hypothetical protein
MSTVVHPTSRRAPGRLALALVVVALASALVACTPAPPSRQGTARNAAAGWLAAQFEPGGLIPSPYDPAQSAFSDSAAAIASLEAIDRAEAVTDAAYADLLGRIDEYVVDGSGADRPGALARLIIAVVSKGGDARDAAGVDLVARLEATLLTGGSATGRFGVQDPTYDGVFRQGLALAALSLVSPLPAAVDPGAGAVEDLPAVAWLLDQQCDSGPAVGGWMSHRSDLSTPCGFDPITWVDVDSNASALAAIGLRAVGADMPADPLAFLLGSRTAEGGWSYNASPTGTTDPDSTGLAMAALESLGSTPDADAVDALLGFQLTAADAPTPADRGAFWYPPFLPSDPHVPNLLATNDALVALLPGVWPANVAP